MSYSTLKSININFMKIQSKQEKKKIKREKERKKNKNKEKKEMPASISTCAPDLFILTLVWSFIVKPLTEIRMPISLR